MVLTGEVRGPSGAGCRGREAGGSGLVLRSARTIGSGLGVPELV